MSIEDFSCKLGIDVCVGINPDVLVPEERIRAYCEENKCGSYGRNYTCPPHAGELDEIREKLRFYGFRGDKAIDSELYYSNDHLESPKNFSILVKEYCKKKNKKSKQVMREAGLYSIRFDSTQNKY